MDEFLELADKQQQEINWVMSLFAIPENLSDGLVGVLFFGGHAMTLDSETDQFGEYREKFEKLCEAMPHVSPECLKMMGVAQLSISLLFGDFQKNTVSIKSGAQHLMNASMALGCAIALLPTSVGYLSAKAQAEQKAFLAKAGREGAKIRNRPYQELKDWTIAQAVGMRDQDIDIARRLSAQIPEHLADVSKNPERLIYDALRAQRMPD